jgi:hypothetical protein
VSHLRSKNKKDLPGDVEHEEHNNHIEKQCVAARVNQYKNINKKAQRKEERKE